MPGYWLFKSEPDEYSVKDLAAETGQSVRWDGIRNFQARNYIRDKISRGDQVFFYHSSCRKTGIAGRCEITCAPYPDPTQFDKTSRYFDGKSDTRKPKWYAVDIVLKETYSRLLETQKLRADSLLQDMVLFKNPRLSIQPVTAAQWKAITDLATSA